MAAELRLGEADGLAVAGGEDDLLVAAGEEDADELVALVEVDGDDAAALGAAVLAQRAVFLTMPCSVAMTSCRSSNSRTGIIDATLLALGQLEEVDDGAALGGPGHLRDVVDLLPVAPCPGR